MNDKKSLLSKMIENSREIVRDVSKSALTVFGLSMAALTLPHSSAQAQTSQNLGDSLRSDTAKVVTLPKEEIKKNPAFFLPNGKPRPGAGKPPPVNSPELNKIRAENAYKVKQAQDEEPNPNGTGLSGGGPDGKGPYCHGKNQPRGPGR